MGFVQADPIRSPARAQDLILRHRVKDYRAGDLDRAYGSLEIEEDYLYAYGFVSRDVWQWLHPRAASRLSKLDQKVLDLVRSAGPTHPTASSSQSWKQKSSQCLGRIFEGDKVRAGTLALWFSADCPPQALTLLLPRLA